MPRMLRLALREYKAAVKTKGFIISLVMAPLLMGGSVIAMVLLKDRMDTTDRTVVVLDRSAVMAERLQAAAAERNEAEVMDEDGKKVKPNYFFEIVVPDDANPEAQRLALSDRVRNKEIHAFLDIGPAVLDTEAGEETAWVRYHAENSVMDPVRNWLGWPVNSQLRRLRLEALGIDADSAEHVFAWRGIEGMGLASVDAGSGELREARQASKGEAAGVPLAMVMLMFMMLMTGAIPLLNSVMEEKTMRIAEVLLGSIQPFEFMMGKVLGGIAVSLTTLGVYAAVSIGGMSYAGMGELIPYHLLPWFCVYTIFAILMMGSMLASFGAACNDAKEAQSLTLPAILPMMVPMFILMPVLEEPMSTWVTIMSLIPPFTPTLMILRQSTPMTMPAWQPWAGLAGLVVASILAVWAGGRIFRVGILMQGQPPRLSEMLRWVIKG